MKRAMIGRPVHDADLLALVPLSLFEFGAWDLPGPLCCEHACQIALSWRSLDGGAGVDRRGVVETIVEPPAALDGHKARVTACVRVPNERGQREQRVAEFATTVRGLPVLRDWLAAHRV